MSAFSDVPNCRTASALTQDLDVGVGHRREGATKKKRNGIAFLLFTNSTNFVCRRLHRQNGDLPSGSFDEH